MYLLYLSLTKLEIFKNKRKISEILWTPDDLSKNLSQIKNTFSSRFRLLLSDEFIKITSLLVTPKESRKRNSVQIKAQTIISENLSQTVWDYKVVANQNGLKLIQIIYVTKTFFDQLRAAINTSGIKITLLESFSTSICRFLPKNKLTFLIYQNLLILSFNQTPIFSQVLNKKLTQIDIDQIFSYAQDRFKNLPQQIIFSPTGDTAFTSFNFSGLKPEYFDIDPINGLIYSTNTHGSDESTSRLEIKSSPPIIIHKSPVKIILIIPVLILLFFLFFKKNKTEIIPVSVTIPTPTAVPTINLATIKIKVLNGSGISGEATKVVNLLAKNNLSVGQTGNASNFDFTQTSIQTKSTISNEITNLIIKSLGNDFTATTSSEKVDSTNPFDIIITTGK